MSGRVLMICALLLSLSGAFIAMQEAAGVTGTDYGALSDRSESNGSGCDGLAGIVSEILDAKSFGRRSSLTILLTGDRASADEPILLPIPQVPHQSRRSIDGPKANLERRAVFLQQVVDHCHSIGPTDRSPIFQGVMRLIEHLHNNRKDGRRQIAWIQSDLEELSHPLIKQAIRHGAASLGAKRLPNLDNAGIDLVFCGIAETRGEGAPTNGKRNLLTRPRQLAEAEAARATWIAIFADPSRVTFQPFCPHVETTGAGATRKGPSIDGKAD